MPDTIHDLLAALPHAPLFKRAYALGVEQIGLATLNDGPTPTDDAAMTAKFVVTTDDMDLDGEVIVTKGIDTAMHRSNPVIYFNHGNLEFGGLPTPIAISEDVQKCYSVQLGDHKGYGTAHFNPNIRESVQFYDLVKHGFLRAASIGAKPVPGTIEKMRNGRLKFNQTTLHEWSIVGVGANPNAIRSKMRDGKIAGSEIGLDLRKSLQRIADTATESVTGGFAIDPDLAAKFPDDFLVPGDRSEVLIRATSDPVCKALLLKTAKVEEVVAPPVEPAKVEPSAAPSEKIGSINDYLKSKGLPELVADPPPITTLTVKNDTGLPLNYTIENGVVTITQAVVVQPPKVEPKPPVVSPEVAAEVKELRGESERMVRLARRLVGM